VARKKKPPKPKRLLAVIDFETDPFKFGRDPKAFACGFYDGSTYKEFWGDDCALQLLIYLESRTDPLLIYAHNGGKFDFFYLLAEGALTNPAMLINGRIVKSGLIGMHELRDSYAILPIPLSKLGNKLDIDYAKLEREVREKNKKEILKYQKADCVELWKVIDKFHERFGPKLTIGATAMAQLGKLHRVSRQDEKHDETFRPYYFGGRVECFENGELNGNFKIYDVNSMYPKAMRDFSHPSGKNYIHLGPEISNRYNFRTGKLEGFGPVYFIRCIGFNKNAIPVRTIEGGQTKNRYDLPYGEFFAVSHEIETACELGLFQVESIIDIYVPCNSIKFTEFIDKFSAEKISAKLLQKTDPANIDKHKADETFAKLIQNSSYGKFATDPRKFKEWFIVDTQDDSTIMEFENWRRDENGKLKRDKDDSLLCKLVNDMGRFEIWQCPTYDIRGFYDVAVAASITGAARSILLRAIAHAVRPVYCDTDSLICADIRGVTIDDAALGAWKFEGATKKIYIAGKKMYACELSNADGSPMLDTKTGKRKEKLASKGAKLSLTDIRELCKGKIVTWRSDAPNFKIDGRVKYVERDIRKII
jgi:DNA polymerase elongation subunit (family B)